MIDATTQPAGTEAERSQARTQAAALAKDKRMFDPLDPRSVELRGQYSALIAKAVTPADDTPKVTLFGLELDALGESDQHLAAGEMIRIMKNPAYLDASDPLHATLVAEVGRRMKILHPR